MTPYGMMGPDFSIYESAEMTMPAAYSAIKGGLLNFINTWLAILENIISESTQTPSGIFNNQNEKFVKNYSKKTLILSPA